jgi:nucleoside-diphosphate-sugar epimerase
MKVLVIGGTVFIGEAITRRLLSEWHDVTLFHRGKSRNELHLAKEILGDRMEPDGLERAIRQTAPDAIVDMIAMTPEAAETALHAISRSGFTGPYLLISSCDVYARFGEVLGTEKPGAGGEGGVISEDSPLRTNLYPYRGSGRADGAERYEKILVERVLTAHPATRVLRLPMVYGPRDRLRRIGVVLDGLRREDPPEPAVAWGWRSCYAFVSNVASAAVKLITNRSTGGGTFHLQDASPTERELWETVARVAGLPMVEIPNDDAEPDADSKPDLTLDTNEVDSAAPLWREVTFEEGIRKTVESGPG